MIYVQTKMKKLPTSCKTCHFSNFDRDARYCSVTYQMCPTIKTAHGNRAYTKPIWCPLIEIDERRKL